MNFIKYFPLVYKRLLIIIILLTFKGTFAFPQKVIPKDYFIPPLDINLIVTGTFGELRPDHFHSGIDFATQNKTGANVYCVADGYVSRIKISATGYGRAIYVTHPNGYVSVYAHLGEYNVVIEDYIKRKQYEQKSFEIELFPHASLFKFKKGDIIGYSGNSGSSSGPHLHFEIRNAATERPFNPMFFGLPVSDNVSPEISAICLYPMDGNSSVGADNNKLYIETEKKENIFLLKSKDTITVSDKIAFGVRATDKQNLSGNSGIYSLEIFIDEQLFFKIAFDSISFDEGRYVNTLIDYPEYAASGKRLIQTYISRGNRLKFYSKNENRGIYYFQDTLLHIVRVDVFDFNKNKSTLSFPIKSVLPATTARPTAENKIPLFRYGLKNHFESKNIVLDLPSDALYDSLFFEYNTKPRTKLTYSAIHQIHNKFTPIHSSALLKIKPDSVPNKKLLSKLTITYVTGNSFSFIKSEWENDFLKSKIRKFGNYTIVADTVAPEIKASRTLNNKKILPGELISFTISDDFSGIDNYILTINEKWVLAEYDAKNNLLVYKADPANFNTGTNNLVLTVTDKLNNSSVYKATLIY